MGIEELEKRAHALFTDGKLSCSEAVLLAMAEYWGVENPLIPRIATPFRGGLCGTQQVCGAVTGGLMAIGIRLGRENGSQDGKACVEAGKAFMKAVEQLHGSLSCRELTGCDFADEAQHNRFRENGRDKVCTPLVSWCCRWLAENL